MRVSELGEFGLIERIRALAGTPRKAGVVLGIGDDAALLRIKAGEDLAVTTDAFVEGVHFRLDQQSARNAGRRALVASLSDLAAMGARPLAFTLALALPAASEVRVLLEIVRGLLDIAHSEACPLVGGNVTRARELSLTLTAQGALPRGRALRRDAGRVGDRVLLTGATGRSALERARGRVRSVPEPRLAAGRALLRLPTVGACLDISDGLLADLGHICRASGLGAQIQKSALPSPRGFAAACRRHGLDPDALLLGGGEDFELLFTLRAGAPSVRALSRRLGVVVSEIGRLQPGAEVEVAGAPVRPGWTHF